MTIQDLNELEAAELLDLGAASEKTEGSNGDIGEVDLERE